MNPLIEESSHEFGAVPFDQIEVNDFIPALEFAIKKAHKLFKEIKDEEDITFENILVKAEKATAQIDSIMCVYESLFHAHCTDEINSISEKMTQMHTDFISDITLDEAIFKKYQALYDTRENLTLSEEENTLLEKEYLTFTRNGALLEKEKKEELRNIDNELSLLSISFSNNVRKSTHDYVLFVSDMDVEGIPKNVLEEAKKVAQEKNRPEYYAFTLEYPSYAPFLKYCANRELRKEIYYAKMQVATSGEYSNQKNIKRMLELRNSRAQILGYTNHAQFVLENRMAKSPSNVLNFLDNILSKAKIKAQKDLSELEEFASSYGHDGKIQKYDTAFYMEKLRDKSLGLSSETLRPYFKLENVIKGVFDISSKLFGLSISEKNDLPTYHKDVKVYNVEDESGHLGLLYADFFPRATKQGGAWMTSFRDQGLGESGVLNRPLVSIVCNFTKPTESTPSLLTLDEVKTLFHEFGHALHGLLSQCRFRSLSGTSVLWDFVELPSQIMENWAIEPECLDMYAKHFETNEKMPEDLKAKIQKDALFMEGLATLRQLAFSYLDMAYHTENSIDEDIESFEKKTLKDLEFYPELEGTQMSSSFGHIFSGGYSSGYYSYKWAEVLDADAFSAFKENGVFDTTTASKFKTHILEKGGSEDPNILYKRFRGRDPEVSALLERSGLS